jgi:hypothetical protein
MIGYGIAFAVGLCLGATAGVALMALCRAASERRTVSRIPAESEKSNE